MKGRRRIEALSETKNGAQPTRRVRTIDIVPHLRTVPLVFLRMLYVHGVMCSGNTEQRLRKDDTAANPPAVASIHELVRPAFESPEFDRETLHLHAPTKKGTGIDLRFGKLASERGRTIGLDVWLQEHP